MLLEVRFDILMFKKNKKSIFQIYSQMFTITKYRVLYQLCTKVQQNVVFHQLAVESAEQ